MLLESTPVKHLNRFLSKWLIRLCFRLNAFSSNHGHGLGNYLIIETRDKPNYIRIIACRSRRDYCWCTSIFPVVFSTVRLFLSTVQAPRAQNRRSITISAYVVLKSNFPATRTRAVWEGMFTYLLNLSGRCQPSVVPSLQNQCLNFSTPTAF